MGGLGERPRCVGEVLRGKSHSRGTAAAAIASSSNCARWPAVANAHAVLASSCGVKPPRPPSAAASATAAKSAPASPSNPTNLHLARPCAMFDRLLASHACAAAAQRCAAAAAASPPDVSAPTRPSASPTCSIGLLHGCTALLQHLFLIAARALLEYRLTSTCGNGWEGQPSGRPMGPDQSVGPGGLATPGTGGCLRALPQQSDALLAFRADGGVVWSTDGAPLAHPVSCLL